MSSSPKLTHMAVLLTHPTACFLGQDIACRARRLKLRSILVYSPVETNSCKVCLLFQDKTKLIYVLPKQAESTAQFFQAMEQAIVSAECDRPVWNTAVEALTG